MGTTCNVICPHCRADNQIDLDWEGFQCFHCSAIWPRPTAVRFTGRIPNGYELALTGAHVLKPGRWASLAGKQCPACRRRGYAEEGSAEVINQFVTHRRVTMTDRHFGPFGLHGEQGRSYREDSVPVTVQIVSRCFGCRWCGYVWTEKERVEL